MDYLPLESAGCAGTNVTRLEDPARPFVPRGRGPDGEGAGLPASAPRGGAVPRARARRRGAGPPRPRPVPRTDPVAPRARTLASPGDMQMRYPRGGGPGRGEGSGGRGGPGPRAPGAHPPHLLLLPRSLRRARRPSASRSRPGRARARARAQTPFLAAFAIRGPAPLIGHCPRRARPARSGPAGARLPGGEQRARVGGATRDTGYSPAPPNLAKHTIL